MPESEDYGKIVTDNLNRLLEIKGKRQIDLCADLGYKKAAVSSWCTGKRSPKMKTIDELCKYFGVERTDFFYKDGIKKDEIKLDLEQELYQRDDLMLLLLAAKDIPRERILKYAEMMKELK